MSRSNDTVAVLHCVGGDIIAVGGPRLALCGGGDIIAVCVWGGGGDIVVALSSLNITRAPTRQNARRTITALVSAPPTPRQQCLSYMTAGHF